MGTGRLELTSELLLVFQMQSHRHRLELEGSPGKFPKELRNAYDFINYLHLSP